MLAFSGFDVIATAAEEAQAPRQHVPRELIVAVIGVALFWAFNAWVLTLSAPLTQVLEYNAEGLTAITPIARAYWARHGLLPAPFARLKGEKRVPQNAVLVAVLTCVAMGLLSLAILRNGLDSFIWWSNAVVFFAALT